VKSIKSLALAPAFLLIGSMALAGPAQQNAGTPPQTKNYQAQNMNNNGGTRANANAKVYEQKGTVSEVSGTSLVLLHRANGKKKQIHFRLTSNTKRQGMVDKGSKVEVFYRSKNGERIATLVKAANWKG
jgi:hypothetical protein